MPSPQSRAQWEGFQRFVAHIDLFAVLLFVVMLEIVLNRLAVPVLRPPIGKPLPGWHKHLDQIGLFLLHLSTALALGVTLLRTVELAVDRELFAGPTGTALALLGAMFAALAAWSAFFGAGGSGADLGFRLETAFVAFFLGLTVATAIRPGADPFVRMGMVILVAPFLLHYYGTFKLWTMSGDAAKISNLPDHIRDLGQRSIALAALLMPLCFAPQPLKRALLRPTPLVLAGFVGTLAAVTLQKHFEVGEKIASLGLGVQLGPGIPTERMLLYVTAVAAVVWVVTSTLTAESHARRTIGVGYALIVAAGYSFDWPVRYLCAAAGALAIATAAVLVGAEERGEQGEAGGEPSSKFNAPPIPTETWSRYLDLLRVALALDDVPRVRTEGGVEETYVSGRRRDLAYGLRVLRAPQGIRSIEVTFGGAGGGTGGGTGGEGATEPAWTLFARPDRDGLNVVGVHPAPPPSRGLTVKTGDEAFDRRFRLQDGGAITAKLLDDGLRARASAALDGWIAVWPGESLHYKVCPGRGAPLDHPIPVTELAFRGATPAALDRLVAVLDLLAELAERALAKPEAAA